MKQITEEQINECAKTYRHTQYGFIHEKEEGFKAGIKKAIELMRQDWIPVTEMLPNSIAIIAYSGGLTITLTFIDGVYYSGDGSIWISPVTHWTNRPEPPKTD